MSNAFNLLPKPTSMLHQIRVDSDDISVESTGSEKHHSLEHSAGPLEKWGKKSDRDYGYMSNSDLVIPQARKAPQHASPTLHSPPTGFVVRPDPPKLPNMLPRLLDTSFLEDLSGAAANLDGIKKYLRPDVMQQEELPNQEQFDQGYIQNMMGKYLENLKDQNVSVARRLGFHNTGLMMTPLMMQTQFVAEYMSQKTLQREVVEWSEQKPREMSSSGEENEGARQLQPEEMIGKLTRSQRQEKLDRYFEKKKKRNWKTIR